MTKIASLKSFLDTYIKNQSINNGPNNYTAYIAEQSSKIDNTYAKAMEKLYLNSAKSRAGYGTNAQSLSNMGLSNSGYAKYIDSQVNSQLDAGKSALLSQESEERDALGTSYKDYLRNYSEERGKLTNSITDKLISNKILDYKSAYSYAISAGLSHEEANVASQNAYSALRQGVISSLITDLTNMHLTVDMAETLAKSYGLNSEDVERVRNYALIIEGRGDEVPEDFLKELENISDKLTD